MKGDLKRRERIQTAKAVSETPFKRSLSQKQGTAELTQQSRL
ncbi:hypothetical protein [Campylobacter vulpis]|nr:hypothetical protein [Campylobacter vulpis]